MVFKYLNDESLNLLGFQASQVENQNEVDINKSKKKKVMRLKSLLLTLVFSVLAGWAMSQTIKLDGELRPRLEMRNGYSTLPPAGSEAAFFVSQRTRFNAFYGSEVFKAYVSMQDVRVWGDVNQLDRGDNNRFGLHQAWGEYFFNQKISLKLGRQELVYDDSRMLGNVGWAQQARSHDVALFKFENDKIKLHAGYAFNQKGENKFGTDYYASQNADGTYNFNSNYKTMQYVWFNTKLGESGLSILFLNNGMESVTYADPDVAGDKDIFKTLFTQTIGARFTPTLGPVKLAAAAYYQMGNITNAETNLSAMYFALAGTIKSSENTKVTLGFEYLSGTSLKDKTEDPTKMKSFAPLYGTNHKFNGHMDYFYVGNHGNNVGLIDIYATFNLKAKKWGFFLTPHYFMAAADVYRVKHTKADFDENAYDNMSKGLGFEVDAGATYTASKNMMFKLGVSGMFGTETLGVVKGYASVDDYKKDGIWAYAMVVFKPNFFTKEK